MMVQIKDETARAILKYMDKLQCIDVRAAESDAYFRKHMMLALSTGAPPGVIAELQAVLDRAETIRAPDDAPEVEAPRPKSRRKAKPIDD